ncbi:glycosyltransferase [Desulfobacter postgatei]|uniref:Glycosyltransferase n=1 Tax=Desulfobacter postgatei 2ac9 TaxID=879212 RepID=I5B6W3_9BACT|nr:glycosyltransferase [Desulfobacter postgatei]EIM65226.1 glycosyltransferase [Desulfobacter postgatei 2ac9]
MESFYKKSNLKVNTNWYLEQYPDVAAAGMDAQFHYEHYGAREGRLPYALQSAKLETALWSGFSNLALDDLQAMAFDKYQPDLERIYSRWALLRWYAGTEAWDKAFEYASAFNTETPLFAGHLGVHLLCTEVLLQCGYVEEARARMAAAITHFGTVPDLCLAAANVGLQCPEFKTDPGDPCADDAACLRLHWINTLFRNADMMSVQKRVIDAPLALNNLAGVETGRTARGKIPKISVIMPVFNAGDQVGYALYGLLAQTWSNIEILVIDDCSTDDTCARVNDIAASDSRVVLLRQKENRGAYAARNEGLKHAQGEFIANHDADDWSHPQRLERMIAPLLQDNTRMASMAHWVRTTGSLHFMRWRMERSLILPSVSTLVFRRCVVECLGGWDEVRVEADSEFLGRIRRYWGTDAVVDVLTGVPLAFALQDKNSLTAALSTHLRTQFWGVRKLYRRLSEIWRAGIKNLDQLHFKGNTREGRFPVPPAILHGKSAVPEYDLVVMADCSPAADYSESLLWMLQYVVNKGLKVALFHWPCYKNILENEQAVDIDGPFMAPALDKKLDLLLPDQPVKAEKVIIAGSHLQQYPPESVPDVLASDVCTVEDPARDIQWIYPQGTDTHGSDVSGRLSALFDAAWYLQRNPDVAEAGKDPLDHYLNFGWRQERAPSPWFDTRFYLGQCPEEEGRNQALLRHYVEKGERRGYLPSKPYVKGRKPLVDQVPNVMFCAHMAGYELFGGERSFLDVLHACSLLPVNIFVSVPSFANSSYIEMLQHFSHRIYYVPAGRWSFISRPDAWAVTHFKNIVQFQNIAAIYVNTLVVREPLTAARHAGVPSILHVRESLEHDPDMCAALGLPADAIRGRVVESADVIVANSEFTADNFRKKNATFVVNNIVDPALFKLNNPVDPRCINVAMISSNKPKKGLSDFIDLARVLADDTRIRMVLIGPDNEHIQELKNCGGLPENIIFSGYAPSPSEALAQAGIVLNLSNFEETFGRTVLEAMAAGRPVLAYNRGALPELIEHGETGFLVPYKNIEAAAERIRFLCGNLVQITLMGAKGRMKARNYDVQTMKRQFSDIFQWIWSN